MRPEYYRSIFLYVKIQNIDNNMRALTNQIADIFSPNDKVTNDHISVLKDNHQSSIVNLEYEIAVLREDIKQLKTLNDTSSEVGMIVLSYTIFLNLLRVNAKILTCWCVIMLAIN